MSSNPQLEKGSRKHICPNCEKRTFKYYRLANGELIDTSVGRCDREINCAYHRTPREWFTENKTLNNDNSFIYTKPKEVVKANARTATAQAEKPQKESTTMDTVPLQYIYESARTRNSNFVAFLFNLFGWETIKRTLDPYFVGCTKNRSIIFPQIDAEGKCRTAKIQQYNPNTGKRAKNNPIGWVHDVLKKRGELPEDFNLQMCLFGLHLIRSKQNECKMVCIVESEKTALIASGCMPQHVWMAVGALSWLNVGKLEPLRGRNIVLYPDASVGGVAFEKWNRIAQEAETLGFSISVSTLLEEHCTAQQKTNGYDIGDYLIDRLVLPKSEPSVLERMIEANPCLGVLVEKLGLVE